MAYADWLARVREVHEAILRSEPEEKTLPMMLALLGGPDECSCGSRIFHAEHLNSAFDEFLRTLDVPRSEG